MARIDPFPTIVQSCDWNIVDLVGLSDGSFVTCSLDNTAKRWLINETDNTLRLAGTFVGHSHSVMCAVEKDRNSIITGSIDKTIIVWDTSTFELLDTINVGRVIYCLMKTNDSTKIVYGLSNGVIGFRESSNLDLISSFKCHTRSVLCLCELEDGSFVSGSEDKTLKRWNSEGTVLQSFAGHSSPVRHVIELNNNTIVSGTDDFLKIFQVSSGRCTHTLTPHSSFLSGLVKLSKDKFVSGSYDKTIRMWNNRGDPLETVRAEHDIEKMLRLGDMLVTANTVRVRGLFDDPARLEIRRLNLQ